MSGTTTPQLKFRAQVYSTTSGHWVDGMLATKRETAEQDCERLMALYSEHITETRVVEVMA